MCLPEQAVWDQWSPHTTPPLLPLALGSCGRHTLIQCSPLTLDPLDYSLNLLLLLSENTDPHYLDDGEVRPGVQGVGLQISAEITTSFLVLLGIFYPSVTG